MPRISSFAVGEVRISTSEPRRGHPKGGLDPLRSRDHRKKDAPGEGGSPKGCEFVKLLFRFFFFKELRRRTEYFETIIVLNIEIEQV